MSSILEEPGFLISWGISVAVGLSVLVYDLATRNRHIQGVMRLVWVLTVAYSGLIGLGLYYWSGRSQIRSDGLWRRACRSVAHCYAGCGAGEVIGVIISVGLFSLGQIPVAIVTFLLAYSMGLGLNIVVLRRNGVEWSTAIEDSVVTESASILVMEAVAISVDLLVAGNATMSEPLFWSSLVVSLTAGLVAAYPLNVLLIKQDVKEGMGDPREMAEPA